MSNYINVSTGEYPVSFARVKQALSNTSFSVAPESAGDFKRVGDGPIPSYDGTTQYVEEGTPTLADGNYTRNWVVRDYTAEQIAQKTANKDSAAAKANRKKRDSLLAKTDWVVIMHTEKGTNIPADMELYRQSLRDITEHANWPHLDDDDWPVAP